MLAYRHIQALNRYIKMQNSQPTQEVQIVFQDHHKLTYHVANIFFPVEWVMIDRVWLGSGGALLFIDPELAPEDD